MQAELGYFLQTIRSGIISLALFKKHCLRIQWLINVSLPTGLGKTFIAAVVMYNFYRWYPSGKIIFMAPTRPLVKQQIDACYNIMAIPANTTAELTGTKTQASRRDLWNEKRVFFITPQVLQNDLNILTELGTKIKCLVFDEAHKAKGNHAYCEVIRKLVPLNNYFRVLALSATPGSSLNDVLEVIHNLLISHLEIRTDESPDVTPYIFERALETVVVPLGGKLQEVRDAYLQILEKYTRVLIQNKVISGNCSTLTKGKIFMTLKDYKTKNQNGRDVAYSEIMRNLNICITLYHAYELLVRHGLRGFLSFFEEHSEKPLLRGNSEIKHIMANVREYLGPVPNIELLPDGTMLEIPKNSKFGHPKFYKLLDILTDHFKDPRNITSRVIVFCEYKEIVMEAYALLLQHTPLIKPRIFVGQGAISQRQQIAVVKSFREGECNTLIATCIGEEGLDVGNVDLIVCFDINNRSPVRMVQRMGRTGRKREGRVVVLVTEGKEQQMLKECLIHKQNLSNHILQSSALYQNMYKKNPRMVPSHINPECQKMFITVKPTIKPQKQRNVKVKDKFNNIPSTNFNVYNNYELEVTENRIPPKQEFWCKANPLAAELDKQMDFSKKIAKLREPQPTNEIEHSRSSELLISLLQFSESKKYNIPMTQVPVMPSQLHRSSNPVTSTTGFKQSDIRNVFAKIASNNNIELNSKDKDFDTLDVNLDTHILSQLSAEIAGYLTLDVEETSCKICDNLFDCSQIKTTTYFNVTSLREPDISILDNCNIANFEIFTNFLKSETNSPKLPKESNNENGFLKPIVPNINIYEQTFFKLDESIGSKNTPLKHPSSVQNVLKKCGITPNLNDSLFDNVSFTQIEKRDSKRDDTLPMSIAQSFIDAEFTQIQNTTGNVKEDLTFFKVDSLEDIFNDEAFPDLSQTTIIYSPAEPRSTSDLKQNESTSPILCSYDRAQQLKSKAQKKLFGSFTEICDQSVATNSNVSSSPIKIIEKDIRLNRESISAVSSKIEQPQLTSENNKYLSTRKNEISEKLCAVTDENNDISAFADLSVFGFDESFELSNKAASNKLDKDYAMLDRSHDLWYDFLFADPEGDAIKDNTVLNIEKNTLSPKNKKECQSNNLIILQNNEDTLKMKHIKESAHCKEFHTIDNDTMCKTPTKRKNDRDQLIDLTISPVLSSRVSQVSKITLNSIKNSKQIKNRKLKLSTIHTQKSISDWLTMNNKESKNKAVSNNVDQSKPTSQSLDLDESFQFSFKKSNTPSRNKLRCLSSSSSGSPIISTKARNFDGLKNLNLKSAFVISSDSDDDFQRRSDTNWIKPKPKNISQRKRDVDNTTELSQIMESPQRRKSKKSTKWKDCDYFDVEAEHDTDERISSDTSEHTDDDQFEESFVDDNTQNIANTTIMHAQYLKSVRSPVNRGAFKIPKKPPSNMNIYSQLDERENTYINDTFCVDSEEETDILPQERTLSELEAAELVLETDQRNSKRTRKKLNSKPLKRRRIILDSDSD